MYCWNCGKEISDDAIFCTHCGCQAKTNQIKEVSKNSGCLFSVLSVGSLLIIFIFLIGIIGLSNTTIPTFMNKKDNFTVKEIKDSIIYAKGLNKTVDRNLISLYKNSVASKHTYKYGYFKSTFDKNSYSKIGVVCNCDIKNKNATVFWYGLYKDDILQQELNFLQDNDLIEQEIKAGTSALIFWNTLCKN